jgi:hypothetical protein
MAEPITAVVTKPASALADLFRKYWLFMLVLLALIIALVMRYRDSLTSKTSTAPGWLKSFLKVSGFLVPVGLVLLGAGEAMAAMTGACAGHVPCGTVEHVGGFFGQAWAWLLALGGAGVAFGITAFSAPDTLDMVTEGDGRSITYTPGVAFETGLYVKTASKNRTKGGAPLVAIDNTVTIDTTVSQTYNGTSSLEEDDLARLLAYMEINSPLIGTVLNQTTGTGPILDLAINFLGQGFNRAGDCPTVSLTVPAPSGETNTARTKYFTFPWAQRYLMDPAATCPWLRLLHSTHFKLGIAVNTALAAVSTAAHTEGATSTIRGTTSYIPHAFWFQPLIPYWRLDTPASGSEGITFKNFGGAGPKSTVPIDYVHTLGMLSNLKGLPGNLLISTITGIIAESFGIDDVQHVDMLVKARLQAQVSGRTPDIGFGNGGNHVMGTTAAGTNKMSLDKLLFLLLRQPSLDMTLNHMLRYDSQVELPIRMTFSSTRTGADALLTGSLRSLSTQARQDFAKLPESKLPVNGAPVAWNQSRDTKIATT